MLAYAQTVGAAYASGAIGANQPNPRFWSNWNRPDGGIVMDLPPGMYNLDPSAPDNQPITSGFLIRATSTGPPVPAPVHLNYDPKLETIGMNDIDALWVPPNMNIVADACGNPKYCTIGQNTVTYSGSGGNTGYPGLYWPINDSIGINNIDTLNIMLSNDVDETNPKNTVPYTWNRHLEKCCLGEADDARMCGAYSPNSALCSNVFSSCTGTDLKNSVNQYPSYQSQYCKSQCVNHPATCESVKKSYCDVNPEDPWCTCMKLPDTPDYKKWVQLMNQKFPGMVINPLSYRDADAKNPCVAGLSNDLIDIFIPYELLADIGHLPTTYSIQDLSVSGNNNVVTSSQDQIVTTSSGIKSPAVPTSPTSPTSPSGNNSLITKSVITNSPVDKSSAPNSTDNTIIYTIIFICIIVAAAVVVFFRNVKKNPLLQYGPQYTPYAPQYAQYAPQQSYQQLPQYALQSPYVVPQ